MKYVIVHGDFYWRGNRQGYTRHLYDAGLYDEVEARGIERLRRDGVGDKAIPLPNLKAELEVMRAGVQRLSEALYA